MISLKKKISLITIICLLIDQISKFIVSNNLVLYEKNEVIKNFFNITYVQNKGAAWGILKGNVFLLVIITIASLFFICRFIFKEENISKIEGVSYGMLLGGILGNLIDRIVHNYVIDFLDFKIFNYDYPVFNVADILIVISVIIMVISCFRGDKNEIGSR